MSPDSIQRAQPARPDTRLRMTRQRKIILEELCKVKTHPTADQIYQMVRKRLPKISLATVYRNMDILSASGRVRKLEMCGTQRRYDGDISPHHHAWCTSCGRVLDLERNLVPMGEPDLPLPGPNGFEILDFRLEFLGVCADCRETESTARKMAAQ